MTTSRINQGPHVDDGDLVRLLDGECSADETAQFRAHLEACPECRENAESLEQVSGLFSRAIAELDPPVRSVPKRVPAVGSRIAQHGTRLRFLTPRVLRAAAVLAAMVLVFAATPARAWLVQGWQTLRSLVAGETVETPAEVSAPQPAPPMMSSVVRFTPRGPEFLLEFTEQPRSGALTLVLDSVTAASAGMTGDDTSDEMILLPGGLRIRNSTESTASYEVRLPLTLSVVEVQIAGRVVLRLDVSNESGPLERELELSGAAGN